MAENEPTATEEAAAEEPEAPDTDAGEHADEPDGGGTGAPDHPERVTTAGPYEHGAGQVESHPHPSTYVGIALILAVATAAEIALFYLEDSLSNTFNTVALLVLMVVKFFLVALWFMHLKFETPVFRRLFYGGIVLAVSVYAVVLGASHVFPILV